MGLDSGPDPAEVLGDELDEEVLQLGRGLAPGLEGQGVVVNDSRSTVATVLFFLFFSVDQKK